MKRKTIPEQHLFYHNTLKLLQNYRDVNWSLEVSAQNLQSEFRAEYSGASAEYVDDLTITGDKNAAARIEGLTLSLDKSRRMMQLVDSAIALMRQKHKKGELYYWILYLTSSGGHLHSEISSSFAASGTKYSYTLFRLFENRAVYVFFSILPIHILAVNVFGMKGCSRGKNGGINFLNMQQYYHIITAVLALRRDSIALSF